MYDIISIKPRLPKFLKSTAHGYMNITSTSNNTNKIAAKKYLIENGKRALPCDSIPHSNTSNFVLFWRFGPSMCVTDIVRVTKPPATKAVIIIGKYSIVLLVVFILYNYPAKLIIIYS